MLNESDTQTRVDEFDLSFKVFHELMAKKVNEILLVSTPYDAFIMEEEGRLAERIIHEYRGLNLSRPPHLTWVSTAQEAITALSRKAFDLVITMPRLDDMDASGLSRHIKEIYPSLPVFLLAHSTNRLLLESDLGDSHAFDKLFVWYGNSDLLLALVKSVEDRLNIEYDTGRALVRVLIIVEDSPIYYSSMLPLLYKEIVMQTQAVMEESLNDEHRILRMRARPKIMLAENFEEAEHLYRRFKPYLLSIFSDVRFPLNGKVDAEAGFKLLAMIKKESPDLPVLVLSSEEHNRSRAESVPAVFVNKSSPTLHTEIRQYFKSSLGFGDFVFRTAEGQEVARASNLRELQRILPSVPDDSVYFHALRNDFSSWLMARSEIMLATKLKPVKASEFDSVQALKLFLISSIQNRRKGRQKGVISELVPGQYDPDSDFVKVGKGSLGGKARGLAFMSTGLKEARELQSEFEEIDIHVPQTLVVTTEAFDEFIQSNDLKDIADSDVSDEDITAAFLRAEFPVWLQEELERILVQKAYPLAVRSSSLLEDAQFQPFAGIYRTYMLPNQHMKLDVRVRRLVQAIKLVYASTYMAAPRSYAQSTMHRIEDEKMAVVIQQLTGARYGQYFYPAISGVAQSYNFYPVSHMKPEEGIAHIALGLGRTVVEGSTSLRFSPKYPQLLPQFSAVDDILRNSQRFFYALNMEDFPEDFGSATHLTDDVTLAKLDLDMVPDHPPVRHLCSYYNPQEHRIRDSSVGSGYPVLTFASVLKYQSFPLPDLLSAVLEMGRRGMGCPVEIEFSVNLPFYGDRKPEFSLLQIRPMAISHHNRNVEIESRDIDNAFCYSTMALGNGMFSDISDIVLVHPDTFDPAKTVDIAAEIGKMNGKLTTEGRKYLLIGPGRWGSADRWLGIPVSWREISGVGAIVETTAENLKADPSQGSHFFHNITSLGISYLNTTDTGEDFIDWQWLDALAVHEKTGYLKHIRLDNPLTLKIDGKSSRAVLLKISTD